MTEAVMKIGCTGPSRDAGLLNVGYAEAGLLTVPKQSSYTAGPMTFIALSMLRRCWHPGLDDHGHARLDYRPVQSIERGEDNSAQGVRVLTLH
jgi:hypothetical protein